MGEGLEVKNSYQSLIINGTFKNLCLLRKAPLTSFASAMVKARSQPWTVNSSMTNLTRYTIGELSDNEYLVGLGGSVNDIVKKVGLTHPKGTSERYTAVDIYDGGDASKITVYIFGVDTSKTSSTSGLQVFDSDGNCVFDSEKKYLRVIDGSISFGVSMGSATNTAKSYCFITCPARSLVGSKEWTDFQTFFTKNGNSIYAGWHANQGLVATEVSMVQGYYGLIADVTGY